jgi:hypothetical protein
MDILEDDDAAGIFCPNAGDTALTAKSVVDLEIILRRHLTGVLDITLYLS